MRVLITGHRASNGQFVRQRESWTPEKWTDGYEDNKGRFRVYRPDFPGAFQGGYALRYHVLWWLTFGEQVPNGYDLHHRNGSRSDDQLANLELIKHGDHGRRHNPFRQPSRECECCGKTFFTRNRKGRTVRFCSQACYHAHPRSEQHKRAQAAGIQRAYKEGRR